MVIRAGKAIDTDRFSERMRQRGIDLEGQKLLISNFVGSGQAQDLTDPPNCRGYGRIRHFDSRTSKGWPSNPLPIVPAARALGLTPPPDAMSAQVFQSAVCNWRCWYCFVDFELLAGNPKRASWFTADELVELYLADPSRANILDLSGGQPDLVPEWVDWMMTALRRHGLAQSLYLWSDDNLSTDYVFSRLDNDSRRRISSYRNYGKVCCLKGFDPHSFAFNTGAAPNLFRRQFELLSRLVRETEIDLYCYITLTSARPTGIEAAVSDVVDRLQEISPLLPLRTVPLEIQPFSPVVSRMDRDRTRALNLQEEAVLAWHEQLERRFEQADRGLAIVDVPLRG